MRRGIRVYGKDGCERCTKAKEKLDRLGLQYEYHLLAEIIDDHGDWRNNNAIELKAETCIDDSIPIIWIKDYGYLRYAQAMKAAKQVAKGEVE